jgi:hypothetical protein
MYQDNAQEQTRMKIHNIRYRVVVRTVLSVGWAVMLPVLFGVASAPAGDKKAARTVKHQITGLFAREREADLRETIGKIPTIKLVSIDFKNAEATFEYNSAEAFPGAKPDQVVQQLDSKVRAASNHTFGVKPLRAIPREKLQLVEIRVAGCDCKACSLAAYEAIYRLEGVEQATASFREGRVTALIDPAKTNRGGVEAALKKRGVDVKSP